MTPERKSQILSVLPNYRALYLGQEVFQEPEYVGLDEMYPEDLENRFGYLSLRSVSDLTEEECIALAVLCGIDRQSIDIDVPVKRNDEFGNIEVNYWKRVSHEYQDYEMQQFTIYVDDFSCADHYGTVTKPLIVVDYLRSIGVATDYYHPTTGLITVDEWVEVGAVQIRK